MGISAGEKPDMRKLLMEKRRITTIINSGKEKLTSNGRCRSGWDDGKEKRTFNPSTAEDKEARGRQS
jgi:hypothetical protein